MRKVTWLHISDFHVRCSDSWSRDTVLNAMLRDLQSRCDEGLVVDFVLVSGDLVFSGKKDEYQLISKFLIELSDTLELSCDKMYCVPGNHDVQRDRQKMCFAGARQKLESVNDVYSFLNDIEERTTIRNRLKNYYEFEECFFRNQIRKRTSDELGYVSFFEIEEFHIAVLGLNTAWLANGGDGDDRQILLGEHQANDAIRIAQEAKPHIVIGLQHHPFDLLRRFDQQSTQSSLEKACQFIHCGHLHSPYTYETTGHTGHCITLAAGASFESRMFRNTYTMVTLDPLEACTDVDFVQYDPNESEFSYQSNRNFKNHFYGVTDCTVSELSSALEDCFKESVSFSYYLASLLLGSMSEVPIVTNGVAVFGSIDLMYKQPKDSLSDTTFKFLTVERAISLLYERKNLGDILSEYGEPVAEYARVLSSMCNGDSVLLEGLTSRNDNARKLTGSDNVKRYQHTLDLLEHLAEEEEWDQLYEVAERTCNLADQEASTKGKRMLAFCLARSTEDLDKEQAIHFYEELTTTGFAIAEDWAALAILLIDFAELERAKPIIEQGIEKYPEKQQGFMELGQKLVLKGGDTDFRDRLRSLNSKRYSNEQR